MYLNKDSFRITKQSTWSNIKHTSIASSIGFVKTTFKYKVGNYLVQMNQIFLPEKIDLETDDENCQRCFMCQSCYREVKKCEKNMKSLKKNPNSTKEFTYKMPPFKNNDLVHTEGKCKCIVEADEHELPAIGGLAVSDSSLLDSLGLDASGLNAA